MPSQAQVPNPRHLTSQILVLFLKDSAIYFTGCFLRLHCEACGILVLRPGMEPMPLVVETWSYPMDNQGSPYRGFKGGIIDGASG